VYDLAGAEVAKYDIRDWGEATLTIHGNQLKAEMYLYSYKQKYR
jgi:hypothetical protein